MAATGFLALTNLAFGAETSESSDFFSSLSIFSRFSAAASAPPNPYEREVPVLVVVVVSPSSFSPYSVITFCANAVTVA